LMKDLLSPIMWLFITKTSAGKIANEKIRNIFPMSHGFLFLSERTKSNCSGRIRTFPEKNSGFFQNLPVPFPKIFYCSQ
jgi:hypothetical protein